MTPIFPESLQQWQSVASSLKFDGRPAIGGQRNEPHSTRTFDLVNPADGQVLAQVPRCGTVEVGAAIAAARAAADHGVWSEQPAVLRAEVLRKLATSIEVHGAELALLDSLQMGMPVSLAVDDIGLAARKLREAAAGAERLQGASLPSAPSSLALNLRVPQGVVAAITPWNFPLFVALSKIGPALATGNSVVLKPSELAPLACLRLADLAAEAGLPPGVLNVVPGLGSEAGQALALSRQVDMVSFTGSTATGRLLMRAAADSNLKSLQLELGGKSPQVVLDDCGDLEALAQALADGLMFNSGQVCVAGSRLVIARSLAPSLVPLVAEKLASWRFGHPMDPVTTLGPLASRHHLAHVQRFIDHAHAQGLAAWPSPMGGGPGLPTPIVFSDVPADAEIAQEEVFGPVAAASSFDTDDEAAAYANNSRYGLVATVWCSDAARGLALARRIRSGAVTVNTRTRHTPARVSGASLEPVRESGFGAEGGLAGLLAYTRARHLLLNLPA